MQTVEASTTTNISSSQTSESAYTSSTTQANINAKPKLMVNIDELGLLFGDNVDKLATRAGKLVRVYCPVKYESWTKVPDNFKDDVWLKLTQEFEFNVPNHLAEPCVFRTLPQKFRTFKYDLRTGPLLGKVTMQEKLDARPGNYDVDYWKIFVENECKAGVQEKHKKYAENQKKRTLPHTCGRDSYANKIHKLATKEGLAVEAARGLAWMDGHVGKDGTVNVSAVEKYEQVKAARDKRKDAGTVSSLNFENDEIAEAFGPENRRTGLLGYSPLLSKKQALYASIATAVMAAKTAPTSNAPKTDHMEEALLQKHTELITNVVIQVMAKQQQNQHSAGHNNIELPDRNGNPSTVGIENRNGNQLVLLYNKKRETVATGHVVYGTEGECCHGVFLYPDERKVCLETIEDGNCPVPDGPQGDDRYFLNQFVAKEWVVWHLSRMEFVESGCE